jgi:hypothetical protein
MPTSTSICGHTGTHAQPQLKPACCNVMPARMGLSDMTISQRRTEEAMTGMRPMERMSASAAGRSVSVLQRRKGVGYVLRCRRLNLSNRKSGKGKSSNTTSVATLIAPEMTMKSGPLKQPPGRASMSQARETGWQTKSWS